MTNEANLLEVRRVGEAVILGQAIHACTHFPQRVWYHTPLALSRVERRQTDRESLIFNRIFTS